MYRNISIMQSSNCINPPPPFIVTKEKAKLRGKIEQLEVENSDLMIWQMCNSLNYHHDVTHYY